MSLLLPPRCRHSKHSLCHVASCELVYNSVYSSGDSGPSSPLATRASTDF